MNSQEKSPKATVGAIISTFKDNNEYVLLTKRKVNPYMDKWCLPGGHIDENETDGLFLPAKLCQAGCQAQALRWQHH